MAETDRPLLNPVLSLHVEPKREAAPTGGKSRKDIVTGRLAEQRRILSRDLPVFTSAVRACVHSGEECSLSRACSTIRLRQRRHRSACSRPEQAPDWLPP